MIKIVGETSGDDIDYIEPEFIDSVSAPRQRNRTYVDNARLSKELVEWLEVIKTKKDAPMPNYVAESILRIATGRSKASKFRDYSYIQDMIGDAVLNILLYIKNFDYTTQTRTGKINAYGYIYRACDNFFMQRLLKEKHQQAIKYMVMTGMDKAEFLDEFSNNQYDVESVYENMIGKSYEYDRFLENRKKPSKRTEMDENDYFVFDDVI